MRIRGGKELRLYRFVRFDKQGDYFVGIYDDVINTVYGKAIVAYCLECHDPEIKPTEKCLVYLATQIARWEDDIVKAKIFSVEYKGKAKSRNNRFYKVFDIRVYSKDEAIEAYPDLEDFIEDILSVPF